ncbi:MULTISPECIES: S66 family peptidase [unclassified Nocardioides]|uniref:S66 family peptidase n=1 Tax=unclassified Nocardioides TaxID=2615069 RepID=UPI0009F00928|nr:MULTISPECIES: S66 peptidase family protein [unclassified Nocardioides]GAW51313.1 Peptidase U61 LD-carboxypeptidase A [Nocardioides sp. PD653-B2]GAW52660.1 Peptidase U61 LD-carboxypeptidase A [Nocardioides sp. PD653]
MRFPRPLVPGDRIGVTAPSSGVQPEMRARFEVALSSLRDRGYEPVVGDCLGTPSVVSAPKEARAAELTAMLVDPSIRAVVPPWGGELAIDLLDQLDWDALASAEPTWFVGYSDLTTVMLPITLRLGWATLHGSNLMDTPYSPPEGLLHWTTLASAPGPFTQSSPGRWRSTSRDDYVSRPAVSRLTLDAVGSWRVLDGSPVDVSGRLIGGCIETVGPLAATPYGDVAAFGRSHAQEGLVVYLEACEDGAYTIARALHSLRYAGWFEHASAVLIGRTSAPAVSDMTQAEAVADALGGLDVPVVLDVECGHVAPYLPLVNGALAHVVVDGDRREITQTLA